MSESAATHLSVEQRHKDKIEGFKLFYDSFKHTTTLATGSLLLLATLLEKFFRAPQWTWLIGATFLLFILSLVGSMVTMIAYGNKIANSDVDSDDANSIGPWGVVLALGGFLLGLMALVAFTLRNFYS
jgi:hypothetical protein